jgi:serine/threonine-protein kinase
VNDPKRALDATMAAPPVSVAVPSSIEPAKRVAGRYEILGLLGTGGMGSVYRARDVELDEIVALKVLRRELVDAPGMLDRFRREVKLARRVTHRNVARAHDIGEHEGEKFLTMELIEGDSLAKVLARGRLPARRAIELAIMLCEGLTAAHDAGVVHRDLKPDNVILAPDGRAVITDFGIARAVEPGAASRTQGMPLGTPVYMAPEQVEGRSDIDARADLYALGVMLFELFTGEVPFSGDSPYAVAAVRLVMPPPDPRTKGVPDAVAEIILRCLERKPADRYASAREVETALQSLTVEDGPAPSVATPPATPRATLATPRALSTSVAGLKSVAVLPFRNGGAPEDEYLADGMTEDLIDQLSMTPGLRVRPRGAVMRWKNAEDVRVVGADLGVDVVVEGSVRKVGPQIRVNVRVLSVADGFQLWAKRFDRAAADVLAVTDEVTQAVAGALTVAAPGTEKRAAMDPAALDFYLRARHAYHEFDTPSVVRSVELFEEARRLAPDDPTVLTGCAMARARLWFFGGEGAGEGAAEAAERAVQVAPQRGEAYLARASVRFQQGDVVAAVHDARKALTLAPALADAHELLGRILSETGPVERALHHTALAVQLDPDFRVQAGMALARVNAIRGDWAEAWRISDEILASSEDGRGFINYARLASWAGDRQRAQRVLDHPVVLAGKAPSGRGIAQFVVDRKERPRLDRVFTAAFSTSTVSWRTLAFAKQAEAEIAAGNPTETLDLVRRSVEAGLIDILWMDGCPLLASIRTDPAFPALREIVAERAKAIQRALVD